MQEFEAAGWYYEDGIGIVVVDAERLRAMLSVLPADMGIIDPVQDEHGMLDQRIVDNYAAARRWVCIRLRPWRLCASCCHRDPRTRHPRHHRSFDTEDIRNPTLLTIKISGPGLDCLP